jgi:hypothetical protein
LFQLVGAGSFGAPGSRLDMMLNKLPVGGSIEVVVDPREFYVATGLQVDGGERYRIRGKGRWRDGARAPCDADGWRRWYALPLRQWNRLGGVDFLRLCGAIGRSERYLLAGGREAIWNIPTEAGTLAPDARELFLFANDWPNRYADNVVLQPQDGGPLRVMLTRSA